jgi:hypothetical protein
MFFAAYMLSLIFRLSLLFGGGAMSAYGFAGLKHFFEIVLRSPGSGSFDLPLFSAGVLCLFVASSGLTLGFIAATGLLRRLKAGPFWPSGRRDEFGDRILFEGELRARAAGIAVERNKFGKRAG